MNKTVTPGYLHGELRVLPSKSASHRAVMMAALARGKTLLEPMQLRISARRWPAHRRSG